MCFFVLIQFIGVNLYVELKKHKKAHGNINELDKFAFIKILLLLFKEFRFIRMKLNFVIRTLLITVIVVIVVLSCKEEKIEIDPVVDSDSSLVWHYGDAELLDSIVEYSNGRCKSRVVWSYDEFGRPKKTEEYKLYDDNDCEYHNYKTEWDYSDGGKTITVINSKMKGDVWKDTIKDVITVKSERDSCVERYIMDNNRWMHIASFENAYDENGRIVLYSNYNTAGNGSKKEYAYDSKGNYTSKKEYSWRYDNWLLIQQNDYSFDDNGNCVYSMSQRYNLNTGKMNGEQLEERMYDEQNRIISYSLMKWDNSKSEWAGSQKYDLVYDDKGNIVENTVYVWKNEIGVWQLNNKSCKSYDSEGRLVSDANYIWKDGFWVGSGYKKEKCYDDNGNLILNANYSWSNMDSCWVFSDSKSEQYDSEGRLIYSEEKNIGGMEVITWNDGAIVKTRYILSHTGPGGTMEPSSRTVNTIDEQGRTIASLSSTWNGEQWIENLKSEITYDSYDNVVSYLEYVLSNGSWLLIEGEKLKIKRDGNTDVVQKYVWELASKSWEECAARTIRTYDELNRTIKLVAQNKVWEYDGITTHWENNSKTEYTYDEYGNKTVIWVCYWDQDKEEWYSGSKEENEYDSKGNKILESSYMFNRAMNQWVGGDKWTAEYDDKGNQTMYLCYQWISTGEWSVLSRVESTYDTDGNLTDRAKYDMYPDGGWRGVYRTLYVYDPETKTNSSYNLEYSATGWTGRRDEKFKDDNGNTIQEIYYSWNNEHWYITSQIERTFDSNGNVLSYSVYKGDDEGLRLNKYVEYEYDAKNRLISEIQKTGSGVVAYSKSVCYSVYHNVKIIDGMEF